MTLDPSVACPWIGLVIKQTFLKVFQVVYISVTTYNVAKTIIFDIIVILEAGSITLELRVSAFDGQKLCHFCNVLSCVSDLCK